MVGPSWAVSRRREMTADPGHIHTLIHTCIPDNLLSNPSGRRCTLLSGAAAAAVAVMVAASTPLWPSEYCWYTVGGLLVLLLLAVMGLIYLSIICVWLSVCIYRYLWCIVWAVGGFLLAAHYAIILLSIRIRTPFRYNFIYCTMNGLQNVYPVVVSMD